MIIGNTVIIETRLEQLNKEFNSLVIISIDVIDSVSIRNVEHKSLVEVTAKVFANPIEVYKLS